MRVARSTDEEVGSFIRSNLIHQLKKLDLHTETGRLHVLTRCCVSYLLQTTRQELSDLNVAVRQKSDDVDGQEEALIQAIVNLRKTVEVKFGKNSRQYLNAPKIPRYPAKKKAEAAGTGTN